MNNVEELKRFKELLDAGIITEEEFEKKKMGVLSAAKKNPISKELLKKIQEKISKNKALLKKILIGIGILAILAIAFFAGQKIVEKVQQSKRAAALETAIASVMDDYGLSVYTVKYVDSSYEVFAEGFGSLSYRQELSCLIDLEDVSVADPCGDGEIDLGAPHVHPGLNAEDSYFRFSSSAALLAKALGANLSAGLYYGNICVYACEN